MRNVAVSTLCRTPATAVDVDWGDVQRERQGGESEGEWGVRVGDVGVGG